MVPVYVHYVSKHHNSTLGLTIARTYCNRETTEAFEAMFGSLWSQIERATSKPVQFKFLHGTGLRAIIMDGCKAQVEGLGRDLVRRNNPDQSGISETDPQKIVEYIARLCITHVGR